MYGVKTVINGEENIYWLSRYKEVTRILVSLTTYKAMEELKKLENWDILEDSDDKYVARGRLTGLQLSVEVIGV